MSENNSVGEHPLERELDCGTAMSEPHEFIPKYLFFSERINTKPKGIVVVKNCNIQNIPQTQECYFGITESKDGDISIYIKGVSIVPNERSIVAVNLWLAKILRFLRLAI